MCSTSRPLLGLFNFMWSRFILPATLMTTSYYNHNNKNNSYCLYSLCAFYLSVAYIYMNQVLMYMNSFDTPQNPLGQVICTILPYFTDDKTEAHKNYVIFLNPCS